MNFHEKILNFQSSLFFLVQMCEIKGIVMHLHELINIIHSGN
jgi:hypothetical protein